MKYFLVLNFILIARFLLSQNLDSANYFKIFKAPSLSRRIPTWNTVDNNVFKLFGYGNSGFHFYKDSIFLQEIDKIPWGTYIDSKETSGITFYSTRTNESFFLNFTKGKIEILGKSRYSVVGIHGKTFIDGEEKKGEYIDIEPHIPKINMRASMNGVIIDSVDFSSFIVPNSGVIKTAKLSDESYLVTTAVTYAGGIEGYKYFLYSYKDGIRGYEDFDDREFYFVNSSDGRDLFFREEWNGKVIYRFNKETFIHDSICYRQLSPKGLNIVDGRTVAYFFESRLNKNTKGFKKQKVVISSKLYYELEKAIYKVVQGEMLSNRDMKQLELYDLEVLKNTVFAKYHYDFDSPYYQAFFNLYSFYDGENRTKKMDGLLTAIDLENLSIIRKALKKYE